jgi:hypothetical protein
VSVLLAELQRGAICLALYPFTPAFPLEVVIRAAEESGDLGARLERYDTIESLAQINRGEVVVDVKLRPVLVLQSGASNRRDDIQVARINSITDSHRADRQNWVLKLENDIHPLMMMVGHAEEHGLRALSYVNLLSTQSISKQAILKRLGILNEAEMRGVSERLIRSLEIDVSAYVGRLRPGSPDVTES